MKLLKRVIVVLAMVMVPALAWNVEQKQGGSMKSVIIYYSYTGNTAAAAMGIASVLGTDVIQVEDVERPGKLKAYIQGAFAARREKSWPIKPLPIDLSGYDRVFIGSPVWFGKQPPEVNAAISQLKLEGKKVVVFVTLGGNSSKDAINCISAHVQAKGGTVVSSFAVSTGGKSKEDVTARATEVARQYK